MRLDNLRRIVVEDFPKEDRQTVGLLGEILNNFMEQVIRSYENNINFENLNSQVLTFKVQLDANGNPINDASTVIKKHIKLDLGRRVIGVYTINAKNQDNSSNYPTANPFIDFSQSSGLLKINKITGLQTAEEYELTIIVIYES